jgi:hypothetical protein
MHITHTPWHKICFSCSLSQGQTHQLQVAAEFTCLLDLDGGSGDGHIDNSALSPDATRKALISSLVFSHLEAKSACELARKTKEQALFATPRHFIELMKQFTCVFGEKKSAIEGQQLHLSVGLQKLTQTHADVEALALSLANREQQVSALVLQQVSFLIMHLWTEDKGRLYCQSCSTEQHLTRCCHISLLSC